MKKLLFVIASVLLLFSSCKEDPEVIIGNWELNKISVSVNADDEIMGALISKMINDSINNYKPEKLQISFNSDNTFLLSSMMEGNQSDPVAGTYSLSGDKVNLTTQGVSFEMTYTLAKKKLSLQYNASTSNISSFINLLMQFSEDEEMTAEIQEMLDSLLPITSGIKSITLISDFDKK